MQIQTLQKALLACMKDASSMLSLIANDVSAIDDVSESIASCDASKQTEQPTQRTPN
jgi:hypothetical protein